jgi:hypothetical protein
MELLLPAKSRKPRPQGPPAIHYRQLAAFAHSFYDAGPYGFVPGVPMREASFLFAVWTAGAG